MAALPRRADSTPVERISWRTLLKTSSGSCVDWVALAALELLTAVRGYVPDWRMRCGDCRICIATVPPLALIRRPVRFEWRSLAMEVPEPGQLAQVMSQATAPAFVLGAVAGFTSILLGRAGTILERIRHLNEVPDEAVARGHLKADIPRLQARARILNSAVRLALARRDVHFDAADCWFCECAPENTTRIQCRNSFCFSHRVAWCRSLQIWPGGENGT